VAADLHRRTTQVPGSTTGRAAIGEPAAKLKHCRSNNLGTMARELFALKHIHNLSRIAGSTAIVFKRISGAEHHLANRNSLTGASRSA
jgi:hypothetical protein